MRIPPEKKPREAWKGSFGYASDQGYKSISNVLIERLNDKVKSVLLQVGKETLAEAIRTCPVRTGALRDTHMLKEFDDRPAVIVYMGSKDVAYGRMVHSRPGIQLKPPAVNRWFEKATEAGKAKVSRILAGDMRSFFESGILHEENWEQLELFKWSDEKYGPKKPKIGKKASRK